MRRLLQDMSLSEQDDYFKDLDGLETTVKAMSDDELETMKSLINKEQIKRMKEKMDGLRELI